MIEDRKNHDPKPSDAEPTFRFDDLKALATALR